MDDSVRVQVLEGLADLDQNMFWHLLWDGLELPLGQVLLQIATSHVFHGDTDHIFYGELFFEPDHIWTVLAPSLQLYFPSHLGLPFAVKWGSWDHFHCEFLIREPVLCQHDLAESSIAQLLKQIVLFELVSKALVEQKEIEAIELVLLGLEIEESGSIRRNVNLDREILDNLAWAIINFDNLREAQVASIDGVDLYGVFVTGSTVEMNLSATHYKDMLLETIRLRLEVAVRGALQMLWKWW